jgi:hypothetical protein
MNHRLSDRQKSEDARKRYRERAQKSQDLWQREVDDFDAETDRKTKQLKSQHENEMKEFEARWVEEDTLRRYRKASGRLLQLWRMEKNMARQSQFSAAELVKAESEELSHREMVCCQAQADRDYHVELEQLKDKQDKEMELHLQTRQHWKEVMLARQQLEKEQLARDHNAVEAKHGEPCRTKEAFQPTLSRPMPKTKKFGGSAEVSFHWATVLPFPTPPAERASGRNSVSTESRNNSPKK